MAEKRRLTREDWADAALDALAEGGLGAVAVEPIAARLGATKGSFYWHFANRDALVAATLRRWADRSTEAVIHELAEVADPAARLNRLYGTVFGRDEANRVELALLAHADDPAVGAALAEVSARRVDYLVECFRELGLGPVEARHRGVFAYLTYVGFTQAERASGGTLVPAEDRAAFLEFLRAAIAP